MTQGERVKEIRKTLNLTLEKFGKGVGITKTAISRIENGKRCCTEQMIKLICKEYNVNEEWLRYGKGIMFNEQSDKLLELVSTTFKKLKPIYQEYILKQIDQLLEIQQNEINENIVMPSECEYSDLLGK